MKSTFQKPDATYPHGSLREQPEMKKPDLYDEKYFSSESWRDQRFMQDKNLYELKKADCRTIPCSENNWKDGQELEEGKDYELKGGGVAFHKLVAVEEFKNKNNI